MSKRLSTIADATANGKPEADDPFAASVEPEADDAATNAPDPFDVERLRLPDDDTALGVQELVVSIPFKKPSKEQFFRVRTGDEYRCVGGLIELKDDDTETYWVDKSLWAHLAEEPTFSRRLFVTAITRASAVFLWGLKLPGADGKTPDWVAIPQEAAKQAETKWAKLFWDQSQRRHRVKVASGITDEPTWPELTLPEMLRLAFKDRVILSLDHPILKKLRGEA